MEPGQSAQYLGFPMEYNLPTEEVTNKITHQITKALTTWSNHTLSLAGQIMVANQVVLASIWYLSSCANITAATFRQTRGLIRNFVWGAKPSNKTSAKISWNVVIQPLVESGVKIIDPTLQASALLTKILVRAMKPRVRILQDIYTQTPHYGQNDQPKALARIDPVDHASQSGSAPSFSALEDDLPSLHAHSVRSHPTQTRSSNQDPAATSVWQSSIHRQQRMPL